MEVAAEKELCCGPTTICGRHHHLSPSEHRALRRARHVRFGRAPCGKLCLAWLSRAIGLAVAAAWLLAADALFGLRAAVFEDAPFYVLWSAKEISALRCVLCVFVSVLWCNARRLNSKHRCVAALCAA